MTASAEPLHHLHQGDLVLLDEPCRLLRVREGRVTVFASLAREGLPHGPRRWLAEVPAGRLIPGFHAPENSAAFAVFALATEATCLEVLDGALARTWFEASREEALRGLETWALNLPRPRTRQHAHPDGKEALVATSGEVRLKASQRCMGGSRFAWAQVVSGQARWFGSTPLSAFPGLWLPLSAETWLEAQDEVVLRVERAPGAEALGALLQGLAFHHRQLLQWLPEEDAAEAERWFAALRRSSQAAVQQTAHAVDTIARLTQGAAVRELPLGSPWWSTASLVAEAAGVTLQPSGNWSEAATAEETVMRLAQAAHVRVRRVRLREDWWRQDGGPLLGVRRDDAKPVALLPSSPGRYQLVDVERRTQAKVTRRVAEQLQPAGYCFVKPFPLRIRHAGDVLWPILKPWKREIVLIAATGLAIALLNMLVPQALGVLVDYAVPQANRLMLFEMSAGLLAAAMSGLFLRLAESTAFLRLEMGMESMLQLGLWDRLLRLEVGFFRRFSSGDLYDRTSVVGTVHRNMGTGLVRATFALLLALTFLVLMFLYCPELAWPAALAALGLAFVSLLLGLAVLRRRRAMYEAQGRLRGLTAQLLAGVAKLRVAGAEERAFGFWARELGHWGERMYAIVHLETIATVLNVSLAPLGTLLVYALAADLFNGPDASRLSTGTFLAFWAAYGTFAASLSTLAGTALLLLDLPVLWARAKPILEASVEVPERRADPALLRGKVTAQDLVFRYREDGPLVLDGVSLEASPGEFVALVGPSGCGKSTFIRLLLGFEKPVSGAVYYDGQDLRGLDVYAVRRQLGVVLQHAQIFSGTILENLSPGKWVSEQEAQEAAEMAGLAGDLAALPMGLLTLVSEGGTNLSGGQRQRLLLARALLARPRILLLDEATSALDNRTQESISNHLARLNVTRIVVAHRMSTVRQAHRIYVMDSGRIVQTGGFEELIRQQGTFQRLMGAQVG